MRTIHRALKHHLASSDRESSTLAPMSSASLYNFESIRFTGFLGRLATALACILSGYLVLTTFFAVHRLYFAAPYQDLWWFVKDMADFRSHLVGLNFLWRQHSE